MLAGCLLLGGQSQRPLSPLPSGGLRVAPFFDGWYPNADGTITFSFGYSNLNPETIEIPLGPNNFIEPKQYDGRQPTSFSPAAPGSDEGGAGRPIVPGRERGVFTVTVPAGFQDSVVWTLQLGGQTYKVPGTAKSGAYQLRWPMAMGSIPPTLDSRQTVRPVAVLREFRRIPFELPSGHRFLCPSGSPTTACGNRNPFLFAHARYGPR